MSPADPPKTARWSIGGRKVRPGRDAQKFLEAEALKHGVDPAAIRRCIDKDEPAGRMLLSMLGLCREDIVPRGRPEDLPRAELIFAVVEDLIATGKTEAEAFQAAPRYLADPRLRARAGVGSRFSNEMIHGKGPTKPLLTPSAVAAAYRKHDADRPALFFDVIDD